MKIGINSRIYQNINTGIPFFIKNLYGNLLKRDSKNEYIFFQTRLNKKLGKTKKIGLPSNMIGTALFDLFFVSYLIKKENIDIFHSPSNTLPFFKSKNIKYILTIHDLSFLVFSGYQDFIFNVYYKWAIGRSLNNADVIIADSINTKKDIKKFYKIRDKKIRVIYPGVDQSFFKKDARKRIIKERYFLSLTTHPKRKNLYKILDILSTNEKIRDLKFIVAGMIPGEQLLLLKKIIKEKKLEGKVILYGYASDEKLKNLYQNAEFFIFPSFYEGFGFPVLEAMASKCPVITSNTSSLREIVPNKKWLVNPYNTKDIAAKIDKLLDLSNVEKNRMINENYNYAKRFTWKSTVEKYVNFFQ